MDGMKLQPFMIRQGEQMHVTEAYVSSPPALTLTDDIGNVWCLGFTNAPHGKVPGGEYAYNVLLNGKETGEYASRIERRGGRIRIFTVESWKRWTGNGFV
jgi:hypothetical protein